MSNVFREIGVLRREGKLHKKLVTRIRVLSIIAAILAGIVVWQVLTHDIQIALVLAFASLGFILGLWVFSRMSVIRWNETEEQVEAGRMDMLGYASLALYIAFEVGLRTFLRDFFPLTATAFLLAGIAGTLCGRALGTLIEIHNVYKREHRT